MIRNVDKRSNIVNHYVNYQYLFISDTFFIDQRMDKNGTAAYY